MPKYLKRLEVGPKATLKARRTRKCKKASKNEPCPPPLTVQEFAKSVLVVDKYGKWMHNWDMNFKSLRIQNLRSLMSAHNCPHDHRSLEYYAKMKGRGDELVTLPNLEQRDNSFKGPYQVRMLFMLVYVFTIYQLICHIFRFQALLSLTNFIGYCPVLMESTMQFPLAM